jgi:hypothetical protein
MPEVAKRTEVNDVPSIVIVVLSLRVHCQVGVQTERSCSTNNAAPKRQTGVKILAAPPTLR